MRLDKLLAEAGFGTRSEVKKLIKRGVVTVNGEVIKSPSYKVDPQMDEVIVGGEEVYYQKDYYLILNKPAGYVTSTKDKDMTVMELVSDIPRFDKKLFPVGRLDKDTEGLLFITSDGELAHRLTHPKWKVPKVYIAEVQGTVDENELEPLRKGVELEDFITRPAKVEILEVNKEKEISKVKIEISEGKYHQVKRMFEKIGHPVVYLKRIKFANLELGDLPLGEYRNLTSNELKELRELVGLLVK